MQQAILTRMPRESVVPQKPARQRTPFSNGNLEELESAINNAARSIIQSKLVICMALAAIQDNALYRQIGFPTFQAYANSGRLQIPKSTASEYAQIGRIYREYASDLAHIEFSEDDGLKKLLLLKKALTRASKAEVLGKLKCLTYRSFRTQFACANHDAQSAPFKDLRLRLDKAENTLFLSVENDKEIKVIKFDEELLSMCGGRIFEMFVTSMLKAVQRFFE